MLHTKTDWVEIAEVNPPTLPDHSHRKLDQAWDHVLVTDNVFGTIRVSPYAYAARITHDLPDVHPTVVVSSRDRNILAIESEVRGAIGNGVDSFLVVTGDTVPAVDHLAHHYEIVTHLRELQDHTPAFEVGMPTRFRKWQFRQRLEVGAQFFVAGPVIDPDTVEPSVALLGLEGGEPPLYLMVVPAFSPAWVERTERFGCVPAGDGLKSRLAGLATEHQRPFGWQQAMECARRARNAGCAGIILMGLKFETVTGEGSTMWQHLRSDA